MHEADCWSFGTTSRLSGACSPLVFEDDEGPHSSSIVPYGTMLGYNTIFEQATSIVGWTIGVGKPVDLWARVNNIS